MKTACASIVKVVLTSLSIPASFTVSQSLLKLCSVKDWYLRCECPSYGGRLQRWSSITWPIFIRGTPRGFNMISTQLLRLEGRHVFNWNNTSHNPLFPRATGHVSDADLAFVRSNTDQHVDTRLQFISVARVKISATSRTTPSPPWGTRERSITHFTDFISKDAWNFVLRQKVFFTLRCYLTIKDIAFFLLPHQYG